MRTKSTRRRAVWAIITVVAIVGCLVVRLVDIQVVKAQAYETQAATKRGWSTVLYGDRGSIVDSSGAELAGTVMRYDIIVSPSDAARRLDGTQDRAELTKDADRIGAVSGQGGAAVLAIIDQALKVDPESQYASIEKGVDVTTYEKFLALDIPWLAAQKHAARTYPNGAVAGNLVGFVGGDGKAQAGLEDTENTCLAGRDGLETYQRASGDTGVAIPGSTKVVTKPVAGGTVETSIDSDLQWFLQQNLAAYVPSVGGQFGYATVVEAKTGRIVAMAQTPSVDPNDVSASAPEAWGAQTFASPYEPGSIFKPLTAAALIDSGSATPATKVLTPSTFSSGKGARLSDAAGHPPLPLTLTGVLMESSNVGMSLLGQRMGDQTRYDYLKRFGIGEKTAVDFQGESSGLLTAPSTWDDQTKYATMFGQGMSATQAQMVEAYTALANGGERIPLSLVDGCRHSDGTVTQKPDKTPTRVVSAATASQVLNMMESVVTKGENAKKLQIPGYRIAAKTGTAQEPDGKGGYLPNYYVSVMGVAPIDDPQYIVSVNIGYPTTIRSSAAAAPLFRTVMSQVLKTYRVKPSTTPPADYAPFY